MKKRHVLMAAATAACLVGGVAAYELPTFPRDRDGIRTKLVKTAPPGWTVREVLGDSDDENANFVFVAPEPESNRLMYVQVGFSGTKHKRSWGVIVSEYLELTPGSRRVTFFNVVDGKVVPSTHLGYDRKAEPAWVAIATRAAQQGYDLVRGVRNWDRD